MSEADIHIPYGGYQPRTKPMKYQYSPEHKTKMALWFVSHCNVELRKNYAIELNKYIPLDVRGACTDKHDGCFFNETCLQTFKQPYKFYLSFENAICKEYMTEKFWEALKHGMVPIALGAPMSDYERLAPPNSFIHVDNFTSPCELAEYLKYLDKNPDVHAAYHAWREKYEIKESGGWWWWHLDREYGEGPEGMWCKVCQAAHNLRGVKKTISIQHYDFSKERLCVERHKTKFKLPTKFIASGE